MKEKQRAFGSLLVGGSAVIYGISPALMKITFAYGGERFDPTAGENDLARTVLTRSVNEFTYNYTEGEELSNTVCAVIRP